MQKVNSEQILLDIKEIKVRQEQKLAEIEQAAREYAARRGYDADMTKEFIDYAQSAEDFGLSKDEKRVLDVLNRYVYEADEAVDEATELTEATNGETVY